MNALHNKEQLQNWLHQANIDTSLWGEGNAKTVGHLWDELQEGEARLQDSPPLRLVDVVQIIIRRGKQILLEAKQELGNEQVRFRNQPPSEKMKAGENYAEAALRCFREELGVEETAVTFFHDTYTQIETETDSLSYPGLKTRYTFHVIEAQVAGLPDEDFWRDNSAFAAGDPVKRHQWTWRYSR
ncbi:MAG: NUDIX domain-containing protein [Anaerolineae bacterium]